MDVSRLRDDIGFTAQYGLEPGLKALLTMEGGVQLPVIASKLEPALIGYRLAGSWRHQRYCQGHSSGVHREGVDA